MTEIWNPLPPARRRLPGQGRAPAPARSARPARRAAATRRPRPRDRGVPPVFRAWRSLAPGVAGRGTVRAVAQAIGRLEIPDRARHLHALADPAAAVALGIDVLHGRPIDSAETDMAMSVLLSHALRGDATAPVVLAHGLAALAHGHPERDRLVRLSDGWAGGGQ